MIEAVPLEIAEFQRIVRNGLGRAVLYLRENDPTPYQSVILDACLYNDVYDQQMNGLRGQYLLELIDLSGNADGIRSELLAALDADAEHATDDFSCIPFLLRKMAGRGDSQARQSLYEALGRDPVDGSIAWAIVKLDGLDGLLAVANRLGREPLEDERWPDGDDALRAALDQFDRDLVWRTLDSAGAAQPAVALFAARIRAANEHRKGSAQERPDPAEISAADLRSYIEDSLSRKESSRFGFRTPLGLMSYRAWGKGARDEDVLAIATDLLAIPEGDSARLERYLKVFVDRQFPLAIGRLVSLVDNGESEVRHWAHVALTEIAHPDVRTLAGRLWDRGDRVRWMYLLAQNYEPGDHVRIEQAIREESDEEALHSFGFAVLEIYGVHQIPDLVGALTLLYDHDPCAYCRGRIVKALHEIGGLPDWIIAECRHDSDEGTRAFVAEL